MSKHTVSSLMNLLKEFPPDLPICNEISLIWFYPDELGQIAEENNYTLEEFESLTREYSTDLCIFEGSWEKDNIVDQDRILPKLIKKYEDKK